MASLKPIATALSILLVVGIAIGLIVGVRNVNNDDDSDSDDGFSTSSKGVQAFCGPTDYKRACVTCLNSLQKKESPTPKDYFEVSISAAMEAINATIDKTNFLLREAQGEDQREALQDCKTLLSFSVDELQQSLSSVRQATLTAIVNEDIDLKNWLSAAISYQQSCLDIVDPPLKDSMTHGMKNATELTSNVLAMVSDFKDIFKNLDIAVKFNYSSRRVLTTDGLPTWFDRRLFEIKELGKPNAVVAQDGSSKFKTINSAIAAYPSNFKGRYIIHVKAGLYNEQVTIAKNMDNVFMYGDGPRVTIVTGRLNNAQGTNTWRSATFSAIGNRFMCTSMGFQNTAGPKGKQAVALRVQSDQSVFYNCRIDGFQDTLYAQAHRQFYRNCIISGTIDIIFGDSSTVIQNSLIIVRRPVDGQQNTVTAQGKSDARESTGFIIHNCKIVPDASLFPDRFKVASFLGRPWKKYSTAVVMESTLADFLMPSGWLTMDQDFGLTTLYFGEYRNHGPGATTTNRVRWKGYRVITDRNEALKWSVGAFLQGQAWITTSTPFLLGLKT